MPPVLAFVFAGPAVLALEEFAVQKSPEQAVVEGAAAAGLTERVVNDVIVTTSALLGETVKVEPPPPKPVPMGPSVLSPVTEKLPFHDELEGPGTYVP